MTRKHRLTLPLAALAVTLFTLCGSVPAASPSSPSIVGHWEGDLLLPGTSLKLALDFEFSESQLKGSIDIPAQGMRGFQLTEIETSEDQLSFALPGIPGEPRFIGVISRDGNSIDGQLRQSGQTFPFQVSRAEKAELRGETPSRGIPGEGIVGAWQGSLRQSGFEMRLLFKIEADGETFKGTLSSLDQNAYDIPVSRIGLRDRLLTIEIEMASARFTGTLSTDGSEVVGNWIQGEMNFPLTLRRLESEPDLKRPQDPVRPYPYLEEEVTFENTADEVRLAGTLTLPKGAGPHPAVVLISGSGPQDRNQALMGHRPFLVLADRLTRAGIAVLRYDDRGYARSTGDFKLATNRDFTRDALAAFEHLQSHPAIDASRIGLVGHSEGGLIAPQAAAVQPEIAFLVLLAGVGVPMEELLVRQSQDMIRVAGGDAEIAAVQARLQATIFEVVKGPSPAAELRAKIALAITEFLDHLPEDQRAMAGLTPSQIEAQVRMTATPWFRDILQIDPRETLRRVECPVLAVNGEKDIQVASEENLTAIKAALEAGGNERVTTIAFPGLNHLFQRCETGATHEYATIEETFNEEALRVITEWIRQTVGLSPKPRD